MLTWWRRWRRRPGFAVAYAKALADIERDHPIDQVRAMNRMKDLQAKIARDEQHRLMDGGGEYQRGEPGLQ